MNYKCPINLIRQRNYKCPINLIRQRNYKCPINLIRQRNYKCPINLIRPMNYKCPINLIRQMNFECPINLIIQMNYKCPVNLITRGTWKRTLGPPSSENDPSDIHPKPLSTYISSLLQTTCRWQHVCHKLLSSYVPLVIKRLHCRQLEVGQSFLRGKKIPVHPLFLLL